MGELEVREYQAGDAEGWLRCRVLSFLHTAYSDDVLTEKPRYDSPAVELVAVRDGQIVGVLDAAVDGALATIETIAVHPDEQRAGVGTAMLGRLLSRLTAPDGPTELDAWTREDPGALGWYQRSGFTEAFRYLHVYTTGEAECRDLLGPVDGAIVMNAFVHVLDLDREADLRARFPRVYRCHRFVRPLAGTDS